MMQVITIISDVIKKKKKKKFFLHGFNEKLLYIPIVVNKLNV